MKKFYILYYSIIAVIFIPLQFSVTLKMKQRNRHVLQIRI